MRAILLILAAVVALPCAARADSVLVMSSAEKAPELDAAMRVVLAGRSMTVTSMPSPEGEMRLERAAAAQRAAAQSGAQAAVWIDTGEICAVTPDGHDFRHAPFPREAASPRAFAAIATSLVDEMIAPAPWAAGFDVQVDVFVTPHGPGAGPGPGPRVAVAAPAELAPPGVDAAAPAPALDRRHANRTILELGPMLSPLTYGIEGGVALPLSPDWRFAAMGAVNTTFDNHFLLGIGAVELRHIGRGATKHWDVGPMAGYVAADGDDDAVFAGVRLARTWELGGSAVSLGVTPVLMHVFGGTSPATVPGAWAAMRWQFPL